MNKFLGKTVGVVAVAIGVFSGAAWYTGLRVQNELQGFIDEANEQVRAPLNGFNTSIHLELISFERHIFTSTARYRARVRIGAQGDSAEVFFVDHLEHGPFPLSRLMHGQLSPTLLTSDGELQRTTDAEPWFAIAAEPWQTHVDIDYSGALTGTLAIAPVEITRPDSHLQTSALSVRFKTSPDRRDWRVTAEMERLSTATTDNLGTYKRDVHGLRIVSDQHRDAAFGDMNLGTQSLDLTSVALGSTVAGVKPLELGGLHLSISNEAEGQLIAMRCAAALDQFDYGSEVTGSSKWVWAVSHVDPKAMQQIGEAFRAHNARAKTIWDPMTLRPFSSAEKNQLQTGLAALLTHKPVVTSQLSVQTPEGESQASFNLQLQPATDSNGSATALIQQSLATADVKMALSAAAITYLLNNGQKTPKNGDPAANTITVGGSLGMLAQLALLAKMDGDTINSTLRYASGQVTFNEKTMSPAEFVTQFWNGLAIMALAVH